MSIARRLTQLRADMEEHFHEGIDDIQISAGELMDDILSAAEFEDDDMQRILGPNHNHRKEKV